MSEHNSIAQDQNPYSTGRLYRRLVSYVWPHKLAFAISILGFAIFATAAPVMAYLMGVVEETLQDPQQEKQTHLPKIP